MGDRSKAKDFLAKPMSFLAAWGAPLALLLALSLFRGDTPLLADAGLTIVALAWMGVACLANAARCGRRHCFYSGPVFLVAAFAVLLVATGAVPIEPRYIGDIVWAALALAGLTFVPEWIQGRYRANRFHD
ncbi:MAG: hypothetical protein GC155_08295 [Alphaproteobacteria bacterium]|nr:hypothetical protein [Alphaproteobacteria bacterium]